MAVAEDLAVALALMIPDHLLAVPEQVVKVMLEVCMDLMQLLIAVAVVAVQTLPAVRDKLVMEMVE